MVQVIPVILTFHTYGTGISAGIISDLYRDHICSVVLSEIMKKISKFVLRKIDFRSILPINPEMVEIAQKELEDFFQNSDEALHICRNKSQKRNFA